MRTKTTPHEQEEAKTHFANHQIRDRVLTPTLGSWLLRSPKGSEFWCRITACDRYLIVTGDFEPTVFAYGDMDPRSCVAWMGKSASGSYAVEKASIGTGHDAVYSYDVDDMVEDLEEYICEALGPKEQWVDLLEDEELPIRKKVTKVDMPKEPRKPNWWEDEDGGDDDEVDDDDDGGEVDDPLFIKACLAGLRAKSDNNPDEVRGAMMEVDGAAIDAMPSLGRRVQPRVFLALAAIARLEYLLDAEDAAASTWPAETTEPWG